MNKVPDGKRAQILTMLCEGSSMRSISRVVDVSINTVDRYLILAGEACAAFHDRTVKAVHSKRVQCDEIWSFCYSKASNTGAEGSRIGRGDVWTWTAIDADSKLIISWMVGNRDAEIARLVAPRAMIVEACRGPEIPGPPPASLLEIPPAQLPVLPLIVLYRISIVPPPELLIAPTPPI